jgi:hypothetical protein
MRIGEILLADGLVSAEDLERTLTNQSRRGQDRLLSMLVIEGILDPDAAARVLSKFHGVPAVLHKHFVARDPSLASLLSPDLAYEYLALPIARTRDGGLVVCMCDPQRSSVVAAIEHTVGMPVVPAVACSRVLSRMIAEVYGEVDDGFDVQLSTGQHDVPPELHSTPDSHTGEVFTLAMLDDDRVSRDSSQHRMPTGPVVSASELMQSIHAKNTGATGENRAVRAPTAPVVEAPPFARADTNPGAAMASLSGIVLPPPEVLPLVDAAAAMARAATRDAVTDSCFAYAAGHWHAVLLFNVKEGMALGLRGVGGNATTHAVDALAFPLAAPSVLKQAADNKRIEIMSGGGIVNDRLARIIGTDEVTAVPVLVAGRLIGILAAGPARSAATAGDLLALASALGDNYARIIRTGKS